MITRIKLTILQRIAEGPIHGYQISKELKIAVSSVYKHINELIDLGFIEFLKEEDYRKLYMITDKGKKALDLFR